MNKERSLTLYSSFIFFLWYYVPSIFNASAMFLRLNAWRPALVNTCFIYLLYHSTSISRRELYRGGPIRDNIGYHNRTNMCKNMSHIWENSRIISEGLRLTSWVEYFTLLFFPLYSLITKDGEKHILCNFGPWSLIKLILLSSRGLLDRW